MNFELIENRERAIAGAADLLREELEAYLDPDEARDLAGYAYSAALEIDALIRKVAQDPEFLSDYIHDGIIFKRKEGSSKGARQMYYAPDGIAMLRHLKVNAKEHFKDNNRFQAIVSISKYLEHQLDYVRDIDEQWRSGRLFDPNGMPRLHPADAAMLKQYEDQMKEKDDDRENKK